MDETIPEEKPPAWREQYYEGARPLRDVPEGSRPREVFDRLGPEGMSDAQLIALLLRSGIQGRSVMELAEGLLREYGSLHALAEASATDLAAVRGMGPVRAQVLKAALELGRRLPAASAETPQYARTPEEAAALMRREVLASDVECFWVLLLDRRYRLKRPPVRITRGILDASLVHPREVFKEAIRTGSAAILLVHNHPSGDPSPSAEDIRITRRMVEAGKVVDIEILDHVIMGRAMGADPRDFVSLRESGLVAFGS